MKEQERIEQIAQHIIALSDPWELDAETDREYIEQSIKDDPLSVIEELLNRLQEYAV